MTEPPIRSAPLDAEAFAILTILVSHEALSDVALASRISRPADVWASVLGDLVSEGLVARTSSGTLHATRSGCDAFANHLAWLDQQISGRE